MPTFSFRVLGCSTWDERDDNVDLEITLDDGRRFGATLFTLSNLQSLFKKNRATGECADGTYLWAANMILVEKLDQATITRTIADLIASGELETACAPLAFDGTG